MMNLTGCFFVGVEMGSTPKNVSLRNPRLQEAFVHLWGRLELHGVVDLETQEFLDSVVEEEYKALRADAEAFPNKPKIGVKSFLRRIRAFEKTYGLDKNLGG